MSLELVCYLKIVGLIKRLCNLAVISRASCPSISVLRTTDNRNTMVICKKWTLAKPFIGKVTPDNFKLVKEDIPEKLNDGGRFISTELTSLLTIIYRFLDTCMF